MGTVLCEVNGVSEWYKLLSFLKTWTCIVHRKGKY